jgi:hypothetical protein
MRRAARSVLLFLFGLSTLHAAAAAGPDWAAAYRRKLEVIRPRAGESPWLAVRWETSLGAARRRAASEGKPIFVWRMAGEPLGCA